MKFDKTEKIGFSILIIILILVIYLNPWTFDYTVGDKAWWKVHKTPAKSIVSPLKGVKFSSLPKVTTLSDSTMFPVSTYDLYGNLVSRTIYWKDLVDAINEINGRSK